MFDNFLRLNFTSLDAYNNLNNEKIVQTIIKDYTHNTLLKTLYND